MRRSSVLTIGGLLWAFTACNDTDPGLKREHEINRWMLETLQSESVENAIISQHTLYAYHFVQGSATLNEIGRSDLAVLAGHYRRVPGDLNVRRGDAPDDLYAARIETVRSVLRQWGVEVDRVGIGEGLPGGDGYPSDRVLLGIQRDKEAKPLAGTSTSSSTTSGETAGAATSAPRSSTGTK